MVLLIPLLLLLLLDPCSSRSTTSSSHRRGSVRVRVPSKRGLSGLEGCGDAAALGLSDSWEYNWGVWPTQLDSDGDRTPLGSQQCIAPRAAEFVPMFWGCGGNCTAGLWPSFRQDWAAIGVQAIMGWNEPDNKGQSNLSPEQAAIYWCAPLSPCQVPLVVLSLFRRGIVA